MNLKDIIKNSYKDKSKQKSNIGGYERDATLSGNRAQVYHNKDNGKTVVSHTGTNSLRDWMTDFQYATGNLKDTKRYKHAEKIQREAEAKYGRENISTTGHSLGGKLAQNLGKKTDHIYTVNTPVLPSELLDKRKNQTDIRSRGDWTSILSPFQRVEKRISVPSQSYNPLKEHKSNILDRLDNQIIFH
jgi:hypothetical protein